eukprot:7390724-Prymnesium_polylepis.1
MAAAAAREALLVAVEAGVDGLYAMAQHEDPETLLQSFSVREHTRLWAAILARAAEGLQEAAPALSPDEEEAAVDDATVERGLTTLQAAAILAKACSADADRESPPDLLDVTVTLHDIIFDLSDQRGSRLQAAIVEMCEAWWLAERPGRDALVPQMVTYLLVRALHESASAADVKRLYACRGALKVLDYADESVVPLKKLLLHCAIKPQVLRAAEGRKLLIFLFGLHPPFITDLHRAIKAQLPVCRKSLRALYGEVYFRAWRAASG